MTWGGCRPCRRRSRSGSRGAAGSREPHAEGPGFPRRLGGTEEAPLRGERLDQPSKPPQETSLPTRSPTHPPAEGGDSDTHRYPEGTKGPGTRVPGRRVSSGRFEPQAGMTLGPRHGDPVPVRQLGPQAPATGQAAAPRVTVPWALGTEGQAHRDTEPGRGSGRRTKHRIPDTPCTSPWRLELRSPRSANGSRL